MPANSRWDLINANYYTESRTREIFAYNKKGEKRYMDGSHLAFELRYKPRYRRKEVGRTKVTGSRGRRRKELLNDVKEREGNGN